MKLIKKKLKEYEPIDYIILKNVKTIREEDLKVNKKWLSLMEGYQDVEESGSKEKMHYMLMTLCNAILFQQRICFIITRNSFKELYKDDKNWSDETIKNITDKGFSNNTYSKFLNYIVDEGIAKLLNPEDKGINGKSLAFELLEEELLSHLNINYEEQKKTTIKYAKNQEKANDNENLDTQDRLEDRSQDRLEDRERRKKKEERREIESPSTSKKITFEQLFYREIDKFIMEDEEISMLAQLAVENCQNIHDFGSYELGKFKKVLEGMCRGSKVSKKQRDIIDSKATKFENEYRRYLVLLETENFEMKQPEQLQVKSALKQRNDEDVIQSRTLNVLKASFFGEEIERLKSKLKEIEDEKEKKYLEGKINFYQRIS